MFYQIVGSYYLSWKDKKEITQDVVRDVLDINVRYDKTELKINDTVTCSVRLDYNKTGSANMVIVDLGIPPGFEVEAKDLSKKAKKTVRPVILTLRLMLTNF